MPNRLRRTQYLPVKADSLEPVVQAHKVSKAHTAMDFGTGFRNTLPDLSEMCFHMSRRKSGIISPLIKGMTCVPDKGPARLQL